MSIKAGEGGGNGQVFREIPRGGQHWDELKEEQIMDVMVWMGILVLMVQVADWLAAMRATLG